MRWRPGWWRRRRRAVEMAAAWSRVASRPAGIGLPGGYTARRAAEWAARAGWPGAGVSGGGWPV